MAAELAVQPRFSSIEEMIVASAEGVRPPEQLNVWEAAERYHIVRMPGAHTGPFSNEKTPYNREPMEVLTSLEYTGMVLVAPARTGKSALAINWLTHTAICDPASMLFTHMSQSTARDWSVEDLGRAIKYSPELRKRLTPGRQNDNIYDKSFLSGMRLQIRWPSSKELSGKTIPRGWIFDYDRIPDDVDGEGGAFDMLRKRGTTFGRFAMFGAESSPGREIEDPKAMPRTPHEAPPVKGIIGLYNRGDRRRWNWKCPQCKQAFEPSFKLMKWPDSADLMESAEQAYMMCPHDGFPMEFSMREELNAGGRWVKDGYLWLPEQDRMELLSGFGPVRSDIASFWLKGPAAAFQTWEKLVFNYLKAVEAFEATGDEEGLKTTTNLDQGEPYTPKSRISERVPEELKRRAEEWGSMQELPTVPEDVRFLIATVDVQKRCFVVQVHGVTSTSDIVVVDGFKIRKSPGRHDKDGDPEPIDPASFVEDWDALKSEVIERTYVLADGSGRHMSVMMTACDSGGEDGVTINAYNFWRKLRMEPEGFHRRFALVKGEPSKTAPAVALRYPDSSRKDRHSGARGDVPVLFMNSTTLKDQASNLLGRTEPGGGMIRFPKWMPDWFYSQLTAEVRVRDRWENPRQKRNEAWDLLYYAIGVLHRRPDSAPFPTMNLEVVDWSNPPPWASDWDANVHVFHPETGPTFIPASPSKRIEDIAKDLA
jgi:phage terminase large subunit GpA-like protein